MQNKNKRERSIAPEYDDDTETGLWVIGERMACLFTQMIPTGLDDPESTPIRIELEYRPKDHEGTHYIFGPSVSYIITGRGNRWANVVNEKEMEITSTNFE